MRALLTLIVILISTISHAGYVEMYDEEGHFTGEATIIINETLNETRLLLAEAHKKLQNDLDENRYTSVKSFFGKKDFEYKINIILVRLEKSIAMLDGLDQNSFKSAEWASHHHPSEDFKSTSFQEMDQLYAVVNWFGEHANHEDEFIDDRHIYLGPLFFEHPHERNITLIHEISHLVGYELEEIEADPEKLKIYNELPTLDYDLSHGDTNAIADSYIWEEFLVYYAEKRGGFFNNIRERSTSQFDTLSLLISRMM